VTLSCLQQSSVIEFIPKTTVKCSVSLSSLGSFYHVLNRIEGGSIVNEYFNSDKVDLELRFPVDKIDNFEKTFNAQFGRTAEGELK
jgi:putative IMPACT (imprinted ancient) family translation regulator